MGVTDWFMKRTIGTMNTEEKESMMEKMTDEFFASMTPEERKELVQQLMPQMMEKMMEGLAAEDRQQMMFSMMPAMMVQMFGGEGRMPSVMTQEDSRPWESPEMSQENFKPWEFCPCGEICEKGFEERKSKS